MIKDYKYIIKVIDGNELRIKTPVINGKLVGLIFKTQYGHETYEVRITVQGVSEVFTIFNEPRIVGDFYVSPINDRYNINTRTHCEPDYFYLNDVLEIFIGGCDNLNGEIILRVEV